MVPAPSPAVAQLEELRRVHRPLLVLYPDRAVNPSRIALLSGSFDPITVAHAALADAARLRSELVVLIYSARRLPKEGPPQPPLLEESIRLEVVERFCRTRRGFVLGLCSHALLADQVVAARTRFPGAELELAMGSDKLVQLLHPKWYPNRARDAVLDALFVGARILYAVREGEEEVVRETLQRKENQRWAGRIDRLDQVPPEVAAISSRSVRRRLRRGEEIGHLVPPEVHRLLAHPDRYGGT